MDNKRTNPKLGVGRKNQFRSDYHIRFFFVFTEQICIVIVWFVDDYDYDYHFYLQTMFEFSS